MFCYKCGEDNPEEAKYCKNCGSELEEGSVFCNECGTKAGMSSPHNNFSNNVFSVIMSS